MAVVRTGHVEVGLSAAPMPRFCGTYQHTQRHFAQCLVGTLNAAADKDRPSLSPHPPLSPPKITLWNCTFATYPDQAV